MSPRRPKMSPRRSQESPRGVRRAAKSCPEGPLKKALAESIVKYEVLLARTSKFLGLAAFRSPFLQPTRGFLMLQALKHRVLRVPARAKRAKTR